MTIRDDSGNLLLFVYKCKIEGNEILERKQLLIETGWKEYRLNNAIQYLIQSKLIDGIIQPLASSSKVIANIIDINPSGINIVEKQPEFKQNFGFTVNLGVLQINWEVQES